MALLAPSLQTQLVSPASPTGAELLSFEKYQSNIPEAGGRDINVSDIIEVVRRTMSLPVATETKLLSVFHPDNNWDPAVAPIAEAVFNQLNKR